MIAPQDRRAVRENADGTLSLRPGVDFREPGQTLPEPIRPPQPDAIEVREYPSIPEFLLRRLPPLYLIQPAGEA